MLPELCLNVTEMVLRIIQGGKKDQKLFQNGSKQPNSGVIWALGISPMATTGRVRSSTLNKGLLQMTTQVMTIQYKIL